MSVCSVETLLNSVYSFAYIGRTRPTNITLYFVNNTTQAVNRKLILIRKKVPDTIPSL